MQDQIRDAANTAIKNTDSFEVRTLARCVLTLLNRIENLETSNLTALNNLEVEERLGSRS